MGRVKTFIPNYMATVKVVKNENPTKRFVGFSLFWAILRYKMGFADFIKSNFINLNKNERKKLMTIKQYPKVINYLNQKEYSILFLDKILFNGIFKEYLKREYMDLRVSNPKEFKEFIKEKDYIFAKKHNGSCGKGIDKINCKNIDCEKLFYQLLNDKQFLVEEAIIQHESLNKINNNSVSNIRINTLVKDGKIYIEGMVLRLSSGSLNKMTSEDIMCAIDEKGIITSFGYDDDLNIYEKHPTSINNIKGSKISYMKEAIEMVKEAALKVPEIRFVGWDVAISEKGPCLIEGNFYPSYGMHQFYKLLPKNYAYKERLQKILKEEYGNIK